VNPDLPVKSKRLFLALWPDEQVVRKIHQHAIKQFSVCKGRVLDKKNWHITLAYFGAANADTQQCIETQAKKIKSHPFDLSLMQCGYWKKPAVAWLAPTTIPEELKQLAADVQQNLVPCGYQPDTRDYQPHITLVRKAKQLPAVNEIQAISWHVDKFCLVESVSSEKGANYQVLKSWDF
jgi:2'-5' RNA ligase